MFGVKLSSLDGPLEQFLQILAVAVWTYTFTIAGFVNGIIFIYLLIYTRYRWIVGLYLCWIWIIDLHTPERGGRISRWVKSWSWWKYRRNYFPLRYEKLPGVELDPRKNYLMCNFPHGLICDGVVNAFGVEDKKYFSQHTVHIAGLSILYRLPLTRDLLLGLGGISSSAKSIANVLSRPGGGHICVLNVGGAQEAYYSEPGNYRIVLKNRKGFVRLALQNGAPLVPVISFGETDLYNHLEIPGTKGLQNFIRKLFGFALIIPAGKFLFFPHKRMVTTLVGKPMEVPHITNPTKEDIDEYHAKFVQKLTEMFEEQKYNYLEKPKDKKMIIE